MLLHIPQIFSVAELAEIRQALSQAQWIDGKTTAGHLSVEVKSNLQLAEGDPLARNISEVMLQRLWKNPQFMSAALPSKVYPPMFNCYTEGGTFGFHVDNAVRDVPKSIERVRTDVSATLFFSDPDEYEGGELIIRDTYGIQPVKLPAGSLVLYPSTSIHQVTPVTKGARLASFFWIQSLIREDAQRTLLYELDQSIQSLTQELPGNPALVQLSHTYHNLLRRWVEV